MAAGCRCRVPLQGAAAGCSRLLLDGADVWQVRFWSCWCGCQAVRMLCVLLELGCWSPCRVPLQKIVCILGTARLVQGAAVRAPRHAAPTAAPCSGTLQHSDSNTLKQHLAAAPCSGTSMPAPKRTHHLYNSSTLKQHLAAAPSSGTLQRHSMPALKRAHHSDSSTLKQHHAAAPCSGTNMPAPKCRQATPPILEVRTPIASLSGEQCLPVGATASMVAALKVHRLQWQADLGHSLVHTTSKQSSVPSAVRLCQMRRKAALVKQSPKVPKTPTSSTEH